MKTNASNFALEAVLSQEQDKLLHLIGYWLKTLTIMKRNYSTKDKELMTIVLELKN